MGPLYRQRQLWANNGEGRVLLCIPTIWQTHVIFAYLVHVGEC